MILPNIESPNLNLHNQYCYNFECYSDIAPLEMILIHCAMSERRIYESLKPIATNTSINSQMGGLDTHYIHYVRDMYVQFGFMTSIINTYQHYITSQSNFAIIHT